MRINNVSIVLLKIYSNNIYLLQNQPILFLLNLNIVYEKSNVYFENNLISQKYIILMFNLMFLLIPLKLKIRMKLEFHTLFLLFIVILSIISKIDYNISMQQIIWINLFSINTDMSSIFQRYL